MTFDIVAMETDILTAIRKGYFQQVRLLAKSGLDVNIRDSELRTPLIYCTLVDERWGVGLARTLLASGALVDLTDRSGLGPLHYATILGKTRLLRIFLNAADFDNINLGDVLGNTALHYAAATGSVAAVESLLVTCVRYRLRVDSLNRNGRTAEDLALENCRSRCAEMIRETRERLKARSSLPRLVSVPEMSLLLLRDESSPSLPSSSSDREQKPRPASIYKWPDEEGRFRPAFSYSNSSNNGNDDDDDAVLDIVDYAPRRKSEFRFDRHSTTPRPTKLDPPQSNGNHPPRSPAEEEKTLRGYKAVIRRLQDIGVIVAAPAKDPRSNPSKLLGRSASDFFSSASAVDQATISPTLSAENWRSTINSLYTDFYFQFSATYRTPVRIVDRERNGSSGGGGGGGGGEMRPRLTSAIQRAPSFHRLAHGKLTGNGDQSRTRKASSVLPPRALKRSPQKSSIT